MGINNNLRNALNRQKEALAELEKEVGNIENSDLTKENERLKTELAKLNYEYTKSEQNVKTLSLHNKGLKNALREQIYNEKSKIINQSKEKMDIYFDRYFQNEVNRLTRLENSIKSRINNMTQILQRSHVSISDDIYQKLNALSAEINFKVTTAQQQFSQNHGAYSQAEHDEFEKLKNEQITDEQMTAISNKNNVERFVGLNLLNIIGIFLIIIGVITAARYTYFWLPDTMKSAAMFLLGAVMLIAGEIMNRKKPNIFSLGITAGGTAVLYTALAASYFGLKILDMYPALALCVLITAAAFFLSTRYNSQTILAFALTGGYLPIFSLNSDKTMIYATMVYFVILNLLALIVSFKKKWSVSIFAGLFLNIAGTIYICTRFGDLYNIFDNIITILYILFAFLNYTLIPIVSTYKARSNFRKRDVILLAINTFFSSLILYMMFYTFEWQDFTGLLSIVFALIYLSLGWLIEHTFSGEKNTPALFYLTGLAFVVLIIPFQFGNAWLTLGWLAEGVALSAYGIINSHTPQDKNNFKRAGFVINALCLFSFLEFDIFIKIDGLFAYKYLAVTAGSLIILAAYTYKRMLSSLFQKFFKYAVIVNLWFYIIYICGKLKLLIKDIEHYNPAYLTVALTIALTFVLAYIAPRIKILSDMGVKIISINLYIAGILWLLVLNGNTSPVFNTAPSGTLIIGIIILTAISLLSVFAMHDLIKLIVMERKLGVEWYPLIVSAYFVIIFTQNLITQYNLPFSSMWISIIYVLTALAWIVFGFAKRYSLIRKFGLGLALLSVVKLFLIDLSALTSGYRIISYFTLGITLVAISFVYQYFNKRLNLEVKDEISENN